jgi:hypothetical protein
MASAEAVPQAHFVEGVGNLPAFSMGAAWRFAMPTGRTISPDMCSRHIL